MPRISAPTAKFNSDSSNSETGVAFRIYNSIRTNSERGGEYATVIGAHHQGVEDELTDLGYVVSHANGIWTVDWSASHPGIPINNALDFNQLEEVTIAADQDDYSPPNWLTKSGICVNSLSGSNQTISGFAAPNPKVWTTQVLFNDVTDRKKIQLCSEHASSLADNRISLPDEANHIWLHQSSVLVLIYNPNRSRWQTFEIKP